MSKHADKAALFLHYWTIVVGTDERVPQPTPEYQFHPARKWRLDWAWPDVKVGLEVDGGVWMPGGGRHAKDDDREKTNALAAAAGWLVFHFSPQMLENDPTACVMQVAETVWGRGLIK